MSSKGRQHTGRAANIGRLVTRRNIPHRTPDAIQQRIINVIVVAQPDPGTPVALSLLQLSFAADCSMSVLNTNLKKLEAAGRVIIERPGRRETNRYRVVTPAE